MKIDAPLIEGCLLKRYKRFLADVELNDGDIVTAHCPNTGSLKGCLQEGARVILRDSQDPKRKLRFTLQTIEVDGTWVNVDTSLPNAVVAEAIESGRLRPLSGYDSLRREVRYGENSRIDILLERGEERCYVEVKSTTLTQGSMALFPDAVTARGRKHLEELARMVEEGHRGVIFFHVSRADVTRFAPADEIDPAYGKVLREVAEQGVEVLAYSTEVLPGSIEVRRKLPVKL